MNYKIFPLGDSALTVDFGAEISFAKNDAVLRLARYFEKNTFAGFVETIPAYGSLTVFYDVCRVRRAFPKFPTAFAAIRNLAENALRNSVESPTRESRLIEIPVCFDGQFALDLDFIAAENNLSNEEATEIFLAEIYRVFMLGFLPGFSYMGIVDEKIATPRRATPRVKVPAGSVGIANRQTGIYSLESPGGWRIIGRTPIELLTPEAENPAFLRAGDAVKFYRINKREFFDRQKSKTFSEK